MREYDLIAEWYAPECVDQTGVPEVTALATPIPHGSRVLDIGCGNGKPLAQRVAPTQPMEMFRPRQTQPLRH